MNNHVGIKLGQIQEGLDIVLRKIKNRKAAEAAGCRIYMSVV